MIWWCEFRAAWVKRSENEIVTVETEQAIAARRDPVPSQVGHWITNALKEFIK